MNSPGELDHFTDEQLVFIDCAQDILAATPGARWHLITEPQQLQHCRSAAFAALLIDTHPELDLTVSVELGERAFAIIINGTALKQRRKETVSFDRWIDRCCRVLTRMTANDLKLTINRIAGTPQRAVLSVRHGENWHELLKSESHAASLLSWVLPFGIGIALSGEASTEFPDWANAEGLAAEPDSEELTDDDMTSDVA